MKVNYAEAIQRVSERTADNWQNIKTKDRQRRNQVVDLYGVPFHFKGGTGDNGRVYISVSSDLVYYMRFQFKIWFLEASNSLGDFKISLDGVDLTPYFVAQQNGEWIEGYRDTPYPNNKSADEDPDEDDAPNAYDVLEAIDTMIGEELTDNVNRLTKPGFKKMEISASGNFEGYIYLYLKYNHVGR